MKINYGVLFAGAAIGGVIGWYYMKKVQVPNAFALGQMNPTTAFTALTPAQRAQLNQSPGLPSPPVGVQVAQQITQTGLQSAADAISTGTGALIGRPLHVRYQGLRRG